jgi:N-acetylmuramoyl-L-alanine amidase
MNVKFHPRLQVQAAAAAVLLTSGLALSHVAAQTPESSGDAQPVTPAPAQVEQVSDKAEQPRLDQRYINCMAKVVHHEAGNQPRNGKIAVAHVLVNRVKQGFADNVCAVAQQPGQFFRIDRYHPDRKSEGWAEAVDVARTVMAGESRDWSKGALFFHANWAKPDRFFRGRTKVAQLEDHDFYR